MQKLRGWLLVAAFGLSLSTVQFCRVALAAVGIFGFGGLFALMFVTSFATLGSLFVGVGLLRRGKTSPVAIVGAGVTSVLLSMFVLAASFIPRVHGSHAADSVAYRERLQRLRRADIAFASVSRVDSTGRWDDCAVPLDAPVHVRLLVDRQQRSGWLRRGERLSLRDGVAVSVPQPPPGMLSSLDRAAAVPQPDREFVIVGVVRERRASFQLIDLVTDTVHCEGAVLLEGTTSDELARSIEHSAVQ